MTVVAEAADAESLLSQVEQTRPELVLLDWGLQEAAGFSALRRACPQIAVIVLSGQPGAEEAALAAGAYAFVSKADPPEQLLEAIAGVQREENTAVASAATPTDDQSYQIQIRKEGDTG